MRPYGVVNPPRRWI